MKHRKKRRTVIEINEERDRPAPAAHRLSVGDIVKVKSVVLASEVDKVGAKNAEKDLITGTVTYIHPERRFYTVMFEFNKGSFCECFPLVRV